MRGFRRIISGLLVLCMFISMLPMTVFAEESTEFVGGSCGANLSWSLVDGMLTIEGEGTMDDYSSSNRAPWYHKYYSKIKRIVVKEGVTSIGSYAFHYCFNATEADLPQSVESIGAYAFYQCSNLTTVTLPEGLASLGEYAFRQCYELTSITIPEGITALETGVFRNCSKLKAVRLPSKLTAIGAQAFYSCQKLTSITIPDSVEILESYSFYDCNIEHIILNGIQSIGEFAFYYCDKLKSVTLSEKISVIERNALSVSSIDDVYYTGTQDEWNAVQIDDSNSGLLKADFHCDKGYFTTGVGSVVNPYQISTAKQLDAIRYDMDACYLQVADIDLNGITWEPIGQLPSGFEDGLCESSAFSGVFDGNGYAIHNLRITSIDRSNVAIGLFGVNDDGIIQNVLLENLYVSLDLDKPVWEYEKSLNYRHPIIGGIAALSKGSIVNCTVSGKIYVSCDLYYDKEENKPGFSPEFYVGGIVGEGSCSNCVNYADVSASGECEYNNNYQHCESVTVKCGGIAGNPGATNINNCINYGNVYASADGFALAGGISGHYGTMCCCVNYGTISSNSTSYEVLTSGMVQSNAGGISGAMGKSSSFCVNFGNISATKSDEDSDCCAGGITGYMDATYGTTGALKYCYNLGKSIHADCYTFDIIDETHQPYTRVGAICGNSCASKLSSECFTIDSFMLTDHTNDMRGENGTIMPSDSIHQRIKEIMLFLGLPCDEDGDHNIYSITRNGHTYERHDLSLTWDDAREYCENLGGHLVTITTAEEQMIVESVLSGSEKSWYWTGAQYAERDYHWITGESFNYANWSDSDPDYLKNDSRIAICSENNVDSNYLQYSWNDISGELSFFEGKAADRFVFGFICEYEYDTRPAFNESIYRADWLIRSSDQPNNIYDAVQYVDKYSPARIIHESGELQDIDSAWRGVTTFFETLAKGDAAIEYAFKQIDVYETILLDALETSTEASSGGNWALSTAKKINKNIKTTTDRLKDIIYLEYNWKLATDTSVAEMTESQKQQLLKSFKKTLQESEFKSSVIDINSASKILDGILSVASTVDTFVEKFYAYEALWELSDSMAVVLDKMYEKTPDNADYYAMRNAIWFCSEMIKETNRDQFTDGAILRSGTLTVGKEALKKMVSDYWGKVRDKAIAHNPALSILLFGYYFGRGVANVLGNADNISEQSFKLHAINRYRTALNSVILSLVSGYENNRSVGNADAVLNSLALLFGLSYIDCDTGCCFADKVDNAVLYKIKQFLLEETGADDFTFYAIDHKKELIEKHSVLSRYWIYNLEDDYPEMYPHYSDLLSTGEESYIGVPIFSNYKIACPVDVYVYDNSGAMIIDLRNDGYYFSENLNAIQVGDRKFVNFASNMGYQVDCVGFGDGNMCITVTESEGPEDLRKAVFYDLTVHEGVGYQLTAMDSKNNSSTYEITQGGSVILADYDSGTMTECSRIHAYSEPIFSWDGFTSCTARFVCETCAAEQAVVCDITSSVLPETENEITKTQFTASAMFNGKNYMDTQIIILSCPQHVAGLQWFFDDANHWRKCESCGERMYENVHVGGTASCAEKAVCTVCESAYGELLTHEYENTWSQGDTDGHWHKCKNCDAHDEPVPHTPGVDEVEHNICTECGYVIHVCMAGNKWHYDDISHWHKCEICSEKMDVSEHLADIESTEDVSQTCTICACILQPPKGLNWFFDALENEDNYLWASANYSKIIEQYGSCIYLE